MQTSKIYPPKGTILRVKTLGLTIEYGFSAYLIDETGSYPRIRVRGGVLGLWKFPQTIRRGILWRVDASRASRTRKAETPYSRISVRFAGLPLRSESGQSHADSVGYGRPRINTTLTRLPVSTSTDSCLPNQYESQLSWAARVDNLRSGLVDGVRFDVDQIEGLDENMYERVASNTIRSSCWAEILAKKLPRSKCGLRENCLAIKVVVVRPFRDHRILGVQRDGLTKKMNVYSDIRPRVCRRKPSVHIDSHPQPHGAERATWIRPRMHASCTSGRPNHGHSH